MNTQVPRARKEGLTVENVEQDVLVYNNINNQAHSLNRTAALVWKYADGKQTLTEIARLVGQDLHQPMNVETVEYALAQLDKSGLLETVETNAAWTKLTRREFMKAATTAAIIVPVVKTIRIPAATNGTSCLENGIPCDTSAQCCGPFCCITESSPSVPVCAPNLGCLG